MRSGPLRHYVTLERSTLTRDLNKQRLHGWGVIANVWAGIEPLTGQEKTDASQVSPEVTHRVRFRYDSSYTPMAKDRIVHGSRVLNLISVLNRFERDREWVCLAVEVA